MTDRLTQIAGFRGYGIINDHGSYLNGTYNKDLGFALGKTINDLDQMIKETLGDYDQIMIRGSKGAIFVAPGKEKVCFAHTLKETNYGLLRKILSVVANQ